MKLKPSEIATLFRHLASAINLVDHINKEQVH